MTHPFGFSPFLDEVEEFAEEHGLVLVDDARGALGSRTWSAKRSVWVSAGAGGIAGVASFNSLALALFSDPEPMRLMSHQLGVLGEDGLRPEALKELRLAGTRARKSLAERLARSGLGHVPETPNHCQSACSELLLIAQHDRDEAADRLEQTGFLVETEFWPIAIMSAEGRQ